MYEKIYKIQRYYTDKEDNLNIGQMFHFLSDIMEHNAESYGAGAEYHVSRDLAWVLVEYDITVHKLPKANQDMIIGTLPYSFKRMFGYRIYHFKDKEDNVYIEGKAKFVLINIKTKQIVKPDQALLDLFVDAHKEPIALPFDKIEPTRENMIYEKSTQVLHSYIDINEHMNNAYYVDVAYSFLDKETLNVTDIKRIKVIYKKEALYNQPLSLKYYQESNGIFVDIMHEDAILCSILFITKCA